MWSVPRKIPILGHGFIRPDSERRSFSRRTHAHPHSRQSMASSACHLRAYSGQKIIARLTHIYYGTHSINSGIKSLRLRCRSFFHLTTMNTTRCKLIALFFCGLTGTLPFIGQTNRFRVMEYNVENLFDCKHDSLKNDNEFLPTALRK